jgi:hypothetical protein
MPEELAAVQLEYRRRRLRIWKSAGIFVLLPVGILVAVNQLAAPPILTKVFAAVTMLGVIGFGVYIFRVSRCPACGFPLWLGGQGTLGGKCLGCGVQLYTPWRSKDGKRSAQ